MINMYQLCPFAENTLHVFQCQAYKGRNNVRQSLHSEATNEVLSCALDWRWHCRPRLLNGGAVAVNALAHTEPTVHSFSHWVLSIYFN